MSGLCCEATGRTGAFVNYDRARMRVVWVAEERHHNVRPEDRQARPEDREPVPEVHMTIDMTPGRDIQQLDGAAWRSVHTVKDHDSDDPAAAVEEWLDEHRVQGATYRVVRTIRAGVITVEPVPAKE